MAAEHVLVDGWVPVASWRALEDVGVLTALVAAALAGDATVLDGRVISLPDPKRSKPDSPPGGTAWVGLDESHVTLHWYDGEDRVRFALDAFTCGDMANPSRIVDAFLQRLPGAFSDRKSLVRTI